jgi:formylglycine-generating enzyme required for sulfatase activity
VEDKNLTRAAWYCANSAETTHPVGQKLANGWGLVDVLGNAWEWTNTEFKSLGYGEQALVDPTVRRFSRNDRSPAAGERLDRPSCAALRSKRLRISAPCERPASASASRAPCLT